MDEATETATTTTAHTTLINLSRSDEEDEAEGIQNLNAAGFEEASHSTTTTTVLPPYSQPAPPQQHQTIKRRKVRNGKTPPGGGGGRGSMDGEKLRRKRLLVEAAKFSNSSAQQEAEHRRGHTPGDDDHVDPLASFVRLATSMGAPELFKAAPPSFVGEMLAHLLRLLPRALASADGAAKFIECLEPFEDLEEYVLPASLYRAVASAKEPPPPPPRGHTWKHRKERPSAVESGAIAALVSHQGPAVTGLQTLRDYLCMNGRDAVECGRRTVITTLTRALLGSWEGSMSVGRELFNESVLKSPDRSGPVGLGLEILMQSLVQEDGDDDTDETDATYGAMSSYEQDEEDRHYRDSEDKDKDDGDHRHTGHRRCTTDTTTTTSLSDEMRACVTTVGNYVRADADTASLFFRDVLPKVLLMGRRSGCGGQRNKAGSRRVPVRMAAFLRSLVDSTRSRNSFNVERMVVRTVNEVKEWSDPDVAMAAYSSSISVLDDVLSEEGDIAGKKSGGTSSNDKQRRRGLVLACLDILGPTPSCISVIRRELVDGEDKASLRSAVADALLEYRRTCGPADADALQAVLLGLLSSLAEDPFLGVRLSALAAVGEACSSDCIPAASLLLQRCLDTSPKVRRVAVRLLVDEFELGIGPGGAALARAVLSSGASQHVDARSRAGQGGCYYGGNGVQVTENGGRGRPKEGGHGVLLQQLLRHQTTLEETDRERVSVLLSGLVEAVLRGGDHDISTNNTNSSTCTSISTRGGSHDTRTTSGEFAAGASHNLLDPLDLSSDEAGRSVCSWEDLAAPAIRLNAACRPSDPAQFDVLDRIIGDIFRRAAV